MRYISFFVLAVPISALAQSARSAEIPSADVDKAVQVAMQAWEVPGVAVAIVHDDEIYVKGYGVRAIDARDPVTPDTLFPLASCSKAFTTTAMAMLVDDGKIGWDDPVRKYLPTFHLADPLADRDVVLRDLLCHRTGLRSHDLLWYHAPWTPEEIVRRAGLLPLDQPFRTRMQYQNTMFTAAGLAVSSAAGKPWDQFIRERILEPLDLKSVVFTTRDAEKSENRISGHRRNSLGHPEAMPAYDFEYANAAISAYASARDVGKWLQFQLGDGTSGGKRLVSAASFGETHTPQMVLRFEGMDREMHTETTHMSYGMAWVLYDYRGEQLVSHGGVIDGARVQLTMVPRKKIAIAVMCNLHRTYMNQALTYTLLDQMLGSPKKDWNAHLQKVVRKYEAEAAAKVAKELAERHKDTKPSRELSAYAGSYSHPAYGDLTVKLERGQLVLAWNRFNGPLEHFHYDTFVLRDKALEEPYVQFTLDVDGKVNALKVSGGLGEEFKRKEK
jgi:CubicO group peptidase (beta-lactamase class C family)